MHLFAYGTLMVPEIWRIVTGRSDRGEPGELRGYRVCRVQGDLYPVMLPSEQENEIARGVVYYDLDGPTWRGLDHYESSFYERISVEVRTDQGAAAMCQAYVLPRSRSELASNEPWDVEWFQREAMQQYLQRLA